MQDVKTGC